jgi:beta-phosphoglucomutase-like phosphatase (HAD superfamily)
VNPQTGSRHSQPPTQERDHLSESVPFNNRNSVAGQTAWLRASGATIGAPENGWLPADFDDAIWVQEALTSLGWKTKIPEEGAPESLLLEAPTSKKTQDRLIHAITCSLAPEAIFLSVDGVLIDVHAASIAAIKKAAATFDVKLSDKKIKERFPILGPPVRCLADLLQEAEKPQSMKAIRKALEEMYQGSRKKPGTRSMEKCRPTRQWLEELIEWIPLGIISPRNPGAIKSLLERFDLHMYMDTVVGGDKSAPPPEGDLGKKALKAMDIERAWWIVAHPDEVVAARKAGLIPIGIVAPGDDPKRAKKALEDAGVSRIIDKWDQLNHILP